MSQNKIPHVWIFQVLQNTHGWMRKYCTVCNMDAATMISMWNNISIETISPNIGLFHWKWFPCIIIIIYILDTTYEEFILYLQFPFISVMCICNGCMPVRAVCKPHSPDLKRGALATDARGCSLWRSLLERPPRAPESRVRDPLGELVWTRVGGYTYINVLSHCQKK